MKKLEKRTIDTIRTAKGICERLRGEPSLLVDDGTILNLVVKAQEIEVEKARSAEFHILAERLSHIEHKLDFLLKKAGVEK